METNIFVGSETEYDFQKLMALLYISGKDDLKEKAHALFILFDEGYNFILSYDEI